MNTKQNSEFNCPTKIIGGQRALDQLASELEGFGSFYPLIVTEKRLEDTSQLVSVTSKLKNSENSGFSLFSTQGLDASFETINGIVRALRTNRNDALIVVGSSETIKASKVAAAVISSKSEDVESFAKNSDSITPVVPFFIIPASARGDELSSTLSVYNEKENISLSMNSSRFIPDLAFIDKSAILPLAPSKIATVGMEIISHAIEARLSNEDNILVKSYADSAIGRVRENLFLAIENGDNITYQKRLIEAALMASVAFSNSGGGTAHALGSALEGLYQINSSVSYGIFLPHVMEAGLNDKSAVLKDLLLPLGGSLLYSSTPDSEKALMSVDVIKKMRSRLSNMTTLATRLNQVGEFDRDQIVMITNRMRTSGNGPYMKWSFNQNEIEGILDQAL